MRYYIHVYGPPSAYWLVAAMVLCDPVLFVHNNNIVSSFICHYDANISPGIGNSPGLGSVESAELSWSADLF